MLLLIFHQLLYILRKADISNWELLSATYETPICRRETPTSSLSPRAHSRIIERVRLLSVERILRRLIPSTALLSRSLVFTLVFGVVDMVVRPFFRLFTNQPLPPLKLIVRTGVGNNIFFPHYYYLTTSVHTWLYFFYRGFATVDSHIVDIGSGVGKHAVALRDFNYMDNERFRGLYHGFDVDPEMVGWCQGHFPPAHFRFTLLDMHSKVYNPRGSKNKPMLRCEDGSIDVVFSQSLFSHLLEEDIRHYMAESFRVLKLGGVMSMTFFCINDLERLQLLGRRWSFRHRIGPAYVEDKNFPESAVAYRKEWILEVARSYGFSDARVILPAKQSTLECVK